jgi:hypothetical protein
MYFVWDGDETRLEEIMDSHPEGGIIIADVGTYDLDYIRPNFIVIGTSHNETIINTSGAGLKLGAQSQIKNIRVLGHDNYGDMLIRNYGNTGDGNTTVEQIYNSTMFKADADDDVPGVAVNVKGPGDAYWAGVREDGVGYRVHVNEENASETGTGIFVNMWGKGSGVWINLNESADTTAGLYITPYTDDRSIFIYPQTNTTTDIGISSGFKEGADTRFINLYQANKNWNGQGILMNFGNNADFTGKYILFEEGGIEKFYVEYNGTIWLAEDPRTTCTNGMIYRNATDNELYYCDNGVPEKISQ